MIWTRSQSQTTRCMYLVGTTAERNRICMCNPGQKPWDTLDFSFFVHLSLPTPQHNVDVDSTKVDLLVQQFVLGWEGGSANWIMTPLFKIMRHQFSFCQVAQERLARIVDFVTKNNARDLVKRKTSYRDKISFCLMSPPPAFSTFIFCRGASVCYHLWREKWNTKLPKRKTNRHTRCELWQAGPRHVFTS